MSLIYKEKTKHKSQNIYTYIFMTSIRIHMGLNWSHILTPKVWADVLKLALLMVIFNHMVQRISGPFSVLLQSNVMFQG